MQQYECIAKKHNDIRTQNNRKAPPFSLRGVTLLYRAVCHGVSPGTRKDICIIADAAADQPFLQIGGSPRPLFRMTAGSCYVLTYRAVCHGVSPGTRKDICIIADAAADQPFLQIGGSPRPLFRMTAGSCYVLTYRAVCHGVSPGTRKDICIITRAVAQVTTVRNCFGAARRYAHAVRENLI